MLLTDKIEMFVKKETTGIDMLTHDFGHLKRTAVGAAWFVNMLGGPKEEQNLAYIAGLLHDIVRPGTDKVDHAQASAGKSREILKGFRLDSLNIQKIVQAVQDHRKPVIWESPLHQSVYLADKILEQMGAFVIFRRCVWVRENKDHAGTALQESFPKQTRETIAKFNMSASPERFRKLVNYQFKWQVDFLEAFEKKEPWAIRLSGWTYNNAENFRDMARLVQAFRPEYPEEERYHREALDYIQGKKFREFGKLV